MLQFPFNREFQPHPSFLAQPLTNSANIQPAPSTLVVLPFQSVIRDTGLCYDVAYSRWLPPPGIITIELSYTVIGTNGAAHFIVIIKNGKTHSYRKCTHPSKGSYNIHYHHQMIDRASGYDSYQAGFMRGSSNGYIQVQAVGHFSGMVLQRLDNS